MEQYFTISKKHIITIANRNRYKLPSLHPNRVLIEHDFIYLLEGAWKIGQEKEHFQMKKGDVLILSANHFHYGMEPCLPETKTLFVHALFDPEDDQKNPDTLMLPSLIHADSNPAVKHCFEKIIVAKGSENELMASVYFDTLLCELSNCLNYSKQNIIAEQIRQMIFTTDKMLKNSEIANALNISVKTAETIFKQTYHTTIHQYVTDTKIEQVKFYLHHFPDMKLYEIANNLGFYDEFHLSRQFKKSVGISPTEYKAKIKLQ